MSNLLHGVSAINVQGKPVPLPGTEPQGTVQLSTSSCPGAGWHRAAPGSQRWGPGRTPWILYWLFLSAAIGKHSPAGTVVPVSAQVWGLPSEPLVPFEKLPWMALSRQNRECA